MKKEELENLIEDILEWASYQPQEVQDDLIDRCFSEEAQEYFGIKDDIETETEDTDLWSDCDDEEFLYTVAQEAGLSKYEYESLMDDYRNLRVDEWLDAFKDVIDEDTLAEFKRRFCEEETEEEEV